jgi:hypothetical protein
MVACRDLLCGAAIAALTCGCNMVLGVDDVSLAAPGPDAAPCTVDAHFQQIASPPSGGSLIHLTSGAPSVLILINSDPKPDGLFLRLYDGMGQHGVVNAPGTYQLTLGDAKQESCGVCAELAANIDLSAGTFEQTYYAKATGNLTLTTASATRLTGSLHNLELRHVETTSGTVDVPDGCTTKIDLVQFDLAYSTTSLAPALDVQ